MTAEHIEFMEVNAGDFETIKHGYMNNIGGRVNTYTEIYRAYCDPGFNLNSWCSDCVFNMMKRLNHWYQANKPKEILQPIKQVDENITTRKPSKRR